KTVQQVSSQKPQPSVQAVNTDISSGTPLTEAAGQVDSTGAVIKPGADRVSPTIHEYFSGWARTDRYGPIVRGDSLSTVAKRLMIDQRYTFRQVSVALFEKNRSSFEQENMNLLKKNSFLNVPTAEEVEQHTPAQASAIFLEHEKQWNQLVKQPRYAAEAEAQRTRYTKHISVGEHADGVAAAPESASTTPSVATNTSAAQPEIAAAVVDPVNRAASDAELERMGQAQNNTSQLVAQLQEQNALLKQQIADNQQNIEMLNQKISQTAEGATNARIDRLKVLISQLQTELQQERVRQPASLFDGLDWLIWLLIGLLVVLLGTVAVLLRREPAHPADSGAVSEALAASEENKNITTSPVDSVSVDTAGELQAHDSESTHIAGFGDADTSVSAFDDEDSGSSPVTDIDDGGFKEPGDVNMEAAGTDQENDDGDLFDVQDFSESDAMDWLNEIPGDEDTDLSDPEQDKDIALARDSDDSETDTITSIAADAREMDELLMEFELPAEDVASYGDGDADTATDIAAEPDDLLMDFELPAGETVSADENDADAEAGIAADTYKPDAGLIEFEVPDDEQTAITDEEEPVRHLDHLLSKFEDDDLEFPVEKPDRSDMPDEDGDHKKD
ncbi:MAG: FimV/HubP family polar landmark protein, partial [Mariprofundus sp.]